MTDAFVTPLWLGINGLLLWVGWQVSYRLCPEDGWSARIAQILLFWWACVVFSGFLANGLGWLTGCGLLVVAGGVAVGVLCGLRCCPIRQSSGPSAPPTEDGSPAIAWPEYAWLALWGLWTAYAMGRVFTGGLLRLPSEWDTLMYHLPLINQWLQAGSLYAPNDAVWYNAANSELVGLWLVAPFSGDFLIALTNTPAVLLLVLSCLKLTALLGLSRGFRHLATLAVVSNYVVFRQMLEAKNDVAVVALFLSTLVFGLRFCFSGRPAALVYAALAFGLLCGVKYYAVGYAGAAALALVGAAWSLRGGRAAAGLVVALLAGTLLFAGYWYTRNAWVTGTPVYPKGLTRSSDKVMEVRPELWQTTLLGSGRPEVFPLAMNAVWIMTGPFHCAAVLAVPVVVAWLVVSGLMSLRSNGVRGPAMVRWALAFLILGTGVILGLTPFVVETTPGTLNMLLGKYLPVRFGLCFLSLAVIGLALLLQDIARGFRSLFSEMGSFSGLQSTRVKSAIRYSLLAAAIVPFAICLGAVAYQAFRHITWNHPGNPLESTLLGLNALLLGSIGYLVYLNWPWVARVLAVPVAVAVVVAVALAVNALGESWHAQYSTHYDRLLGGNFFQSMAHLDPRDTPICVIGDRYYPFFSSRRQFRASRPGYMLSAREVLHYLHDRGATLVAAVRHDHTGTGRYDRRGDWLDDYPRIFLKLQDTSLSNGHYEIRRIDREALRLELQAGTDSVNPSPR